MGGEAGWWTTSGNIGLPTLARVMGVCRQQQDRTYIIKHSISLRTSGMISMVFACNGRPIPYVDVKAMYGKEIIEKLN